MRMMSTLSHSGENTHALRFLAVEFVSWNQKVGVFRRSRVCVLTAAQWDAMSMLSGVVNVSKKTLWCSVKSRMKSSYQPPLDTPDCMSRRTDAQFKWVYFVIILIKYYLTYRYSHLESCLFLLLKKQSKSHKHDVQFWNLFTVQYHTAACRIKFISGRTV